MCTSGPVTRYCVNATRQRDLQPEPTMAAFRMDVRGTPLVVKKCQAFLTKRSHSLFPAFQSGQTKCATPAMYGVTLYNVLGQPWYIVRGYPIHCPRTAWHTVGFLYSSKGTLKGSRLIIACLGGWCKHAFFGGACVINSS